MPRSVVIGLLLWVLPQWAWAHLVSESFGDFYNGILHPLTTLLHVVPWLALGLFGGLQRRQTGSSALLVFPLSVGGGSLLGSFLPPLDIVDAVNVLSFTALGLMIALNVRLSLAVFIGSTLVLGLSHGYGNGNDQLEGRQVLLYASGVLVAGYLSTALVTAATHALVQRWSWGRVAVRTAGSWVSAVGVLYAAYLLSGAPT